MSVYDKAARIIADTIAGFRDEDELEIADRILTALGDARITPTVMRASRDMFTRFHAHCRFLGNETGDGYEYWYNEAINYAVQQDKWPVKLIPQTVTIAGEQIVIDVQVPESTTKATNTQLLCAYEIVTDAAEAHKIRLPEHII